MKTPSLPSRLNRLWTRTFQTAKRHYGYSSERGEIWPPNRYISDCGVAPLPRMAKTHLLRQPTSRMICARPFSRCFVLGASPSSKAMSYVTSKTNYTTHASLIFAFQQRQGALCAVIFGNELLKSILLQTCLFTAISLGEAEILLATYALPGQTTAGIRDTNTGLR
jgi:hypothetical protein